MVTWEQFLQWADVAGNAAAVLTGGVAVWLWFRLRGDDKKRMTKLETYLREARESGGNYQHSALHLSARLRVSEGQIFEAATASPNIEMVVGQDEQGYANRILFMYTTGDAADDLALERRGPRKKAR